MNEREFAAKKRADWDQLQALVTRANRRRGLKSLTRDELVSLGPLYRRVSSDLARARSNDANPDLIKHLNGLVGRSHALLYESEKSANPFKSVIDFYIYEFPAVLQRRYKSFLAAIAISAFGLVLGYWIVIHNPSSSDLFIDAGLRESAEAWKSKHVTESAHIEQSGFLMAHNLQVGLMAFALGIALIPDVVAMFNNGAMLGAMSALMTQVGGHATFWPGILPHGIAELTAIFICGAAGFILALALIVPAPYTRTDALKLATTDAIKMVLGTIPLFIFAGMIEGMFSHQDLPSWFRYSFAAINGIAWYLYLFLPRSRKDKVKGIGSNKESVIMSASQRNPVTMRNVNS